jgi:hypothetical protein
MIKRHRWLLPALLLAAGSCTGMAGRASAGPAGDPRVSPALFAAALDHLARDARGRLLVDPRPLRPDADLGGVDPGDLMGGAEDVTRVRAEVLASRGLASTDATLDQRCTFSEGAGLPPGREALLADSIRQRAAECRAREPYTTLIFTLPRAATGNGYPPGTWRVRAVRMSRAGFQIWDVYLRAVHPDWEVVAAEQAFSISS